VSKQHLGIATTASTPAAAFCCRAHTLITCHFSPAAACPYARAPPYYYCTCYTLPALPAHTALLHTLRAPFTPHACLYTACHSRTLHSPHYFSPPRAHHSRHTYPRSSSASPRLPLLPAHLSSPTTTCYSRILRAPHTSLFTPLAPTHSGFHRSC